MSRAIFLDFLWSLVGFLPIIILVFVGFNLGRWDLNPIHILGKVFRRGKGVPQREYLRSLGECPNKMIGEGAGSSLTRFEGVFTLLQDSRLSHSQLELIIRDLYDDNAICAYTGHRHKDEQFKLIDILGGLDAISNRLLYYPQVTRRMSPELLDFFITSIAPWVCNIAYCSSNDEDFGMNINLFRLTGCLIDGMTRFLLDDKISQTTRHSAFWQFVVEEHRSDLAPLPRPLLHNLYLKTLLKKVLPSLSYITYDDVYRLAQSNSAQMRDIAKASPLLQEEDKVMIILLDNDPSAEPF